MKKIIFALVLSSSLSFAGTLDAANSASISPMLGFNQGQLVMGLDYEKALNAHVGFGGYFTFTPEKKDLDYPQLIALGVDVKAHMSVEKLDVYVRPGFGLAFASLDDLSKSFLAPIFGIGLQYALSDKTLLGVEKLTVFNWSEKIDFSSESFVATARFKF